MVIDSHQHFWNYDPKRDSWITDQMAVIRRNFSPTDLEPILRQHKIDGCVAVQADQSETETDYLLAFADQHAFIKGVVGWTDLRSAHLRERLTHYQPNKNLKGFRHILQSETSGFMLQPEFIQGVRQLDEFNFTYDLLIYQHQLEEAIAFLSKTRRVRIVVDHLAKPDLKRHTKRDDWRKAMKEVSGFENVHVKLSGMVTEAHWNNWKFEDFLPYIDDVFEFFGTERIMYGSDWPVCLLSGAYEAQLGIVEKYISKLSLDERNLVMGLNAVSFYNLF